MWEWKSCYLFFQCSFDLSSLRIFSVIFSVNIAYLLFFFCLKIRFLNRFLKWWKLYIWTWKINRWIIKRIIDEFSATTFNRTIYTPFQLVFLILSIHTILRVTFQFDELHTSHDTELFSLENYFLNIDITAFLFYLDKEIWNISKQISTKSKKKYLEFSTVQNFFLYKFKVNTNRRVIFTSLFENIRRVWKWERCIFRPQGISRSSTINPEEKRFVDFPGEGPSADINNRDFSPPWQEFIVPENCGSFVSFSIPFKGVAAKIHWDLTQGARP